MPVKRFPGQKWRSDCEYLFFRNYISNEQKLVQGLEPAKGMSAYACQCEWKSVKEIVELSATQGLIAKWSCGGHIIE